MGNKLKQSVEISVQNQCFGQSYLDQSARPTCPLGFNLNVIIYIYRSVYYSFAICVILA